LLTLLARPHDINTDDINTDDINTVAKGYLQSFLLVVGSCQLSDGTSLDYSDKQEDQ